MAEAITNVASVLDDEMSSEQRDVLAKNLLGPIGEVMGTTSPSVDKSAVNEVKSDIIQWKFYNDSFYFKILIFEREIITQF